ncbi:MAG: hypothetical protein ABI679_06380 [Gemmatimonadota bacterium]
MMETALPMSSWESFYVIVGSSGGALTGLQFVVMALIADTDAPRGPKEIAAFGTPTVVHFCLVLLISAILSAPWTSLSGPAYALAGCGTFGVIYAAIVTIRARNTGYKPVMEDLIWHVFLPFLAYLALLTAAITLPRYSTVSLFVVAAVTLLLLFDGIHNAWDTVTYVTVNPALLAKASGRSTGKADTGAT